MPTNRATLHPSPKSIAHYVKKNAKHVRKAQKQQHMSSQNVREADYRGHHIVVRTQYEIEVDGRVVTGHLGVSNDGQVHYHPVPNLSFASAVELVKQLIDIFPDDFGSRPHRMHRKKNRTPHRHKHM